MGVCALHACLVPLCLQMVVNIVGELGTTPFALNHRAISPAQPPLTRPVILLLHLSLGLSTGMFIWLVAGQISARRGGEGTWEQSSSHHRRRQREEVEDL